MFLQQTMSPWFAVQRASQVTMLLLAVAMLFIPLLYQPEEAEAGWWLLAAAIVGGIFLIVESHPDHCPYCDNHVSTVSQHEVDCTICQYPYVSCQESHVHCTGPCKAVVSSSSSEHQYYCYYHKCYYYNCGGSNPHASCD